MRRSGVGGFVRWLSLGLMSVGVVGLVWAQESGGRVSDSDVETLIKNLQQDATKFVSTFNQGVKKSTVRGTSKEKDAKTMVAGFPKEVSSLLSQFKSKKTGGDALAAVLGSGDKIRKFLDEVTVDGTAEPWKKMQSEMEQVAAAFQVKVPWAPEG